MAEDITPHRSSEEIDLKDSELTVISDVHIRRPDEENFSILLKALELVKSKAAQKPQTLLLLGDIFDFCLGRGRFFSSKFARFGQALEDLNKAGVSVYFVEGNHEFSMSTIGWKGVRVSDDEIIFKVGNKSLAVCHGDLLGAPKKYQIFRKLIKSKFVIFLASIVPGKWLDWYALKQSSYSRSFDEYRKLDHNRIVSAASSWMSSRGATFGAFGHFHVPYSEHMGEQRIFSLDCWDKPNLLMFEDAGVSRHYWEKNKGAFVARPLVSILSPS